VRARMCVCVCVCFVCVHVHLPDPCTAPLLHQFTSLD
jgi:hypothetical protein